MISEFGSVRVPASAANLGPGFDTLAVALPLYLTVSATPAAQFGFRGSGAGASETVGEGHLVHRLVLAAAGTDKVSLSIDSEIPLARGLGSSGALAIGVAAACGHPDPLAVALEFEGHPENVAASYYGGLVAALMDGQQVVVRKIPVDVDLRFVVVIPEDRLSTKAARRALPTEVPFGDAVATISRAVLLSQSFSRLELLAPVLFEDLIHQPYRGKIYPLASTLMGVLVDAGCIGACWSGAGSSCLGVAAAAETAAIRLRVERSLEARGVKAAVLAMAPDLEGIRRFSGARP